MFKNFIDPLKDLLIDAYSLNPNDALGLALSGMKDLWGYPDFDQLMIDKYYVSTQDVQDVYDDYFKGLKGIKC